MFIQHALGHQKKMKEWLSGFWTSMIIWNLLISKKINGMVEGIDMPQVARMCPHHFKGEGQFVAKLRDTRMPEARSVKPVKI